MVLAVLVAIGLLADAPHRQGRRSRRPPTRTRSPRRWPAAAWRWEPRRSTRPIPAATNPGRRGDSPLAPFPRDGPTYAVLSTGDATQADQPEWVSRHRQHGADTRQTAATRRATPRCSRSRSASRPAPTACRSTSVSCPRSTRTSSAPSSTTPSSPSSTPRPGRRRLGDRRHHLGLENDFALDPDGHPVTINSTGQSRMSAADAAGTPYGGATAPLRAKTVVTPGTHTVYLSIFDQGDTALDSVVFADALRTEQRVRRRRACAARRPSARRSPSPARPRLHLADALPDAHRHGRRRARRRPHRDRPHLQRRGHVRRARARR